MPDPALSRYLGVPGWLALWALALVAFALFARRVVRIVGVLRRARAEIRWDRAPRRLAVALANVLGQPRLVEERAIGVAHLAIFWAFVFFAASFFWNLVRGLMPWLRVPYADEVAWIALPMEVLGALALVALAVAAARRYVWTPPGLERTRDASIVLGLITLVLVTFLGAEGARAVAGGGGGAGLPVGRVVGQALAGLGLTAGGAAALYLALWWAHMATVLGFLAYLPYSKHGHLIFSPFGVFFTSLTRGAMPAESEGAARLEDFTWRELFNGLTCAECGRCERACPAHAAGYALSPRELVHKVKLLVTEAVAAPRAAVAAGNGHGSGAPAGSNAATEGAASGGNGNGAGKPRFVGDVVSPAEIWACTTCLACMTRCPVFNEHIPLIVEMRRHLVAQSEVEQRLQDVLVNLGRYGNSFGKSARARAAWTTGLAAPIKDARKEPVEYLWIVGDYASYDPRVQSVTRAAATVFQRAGLDFGILYDGEQNAGNDVRRVGEEGLFGVLREKNVKALAKARFRTVVTTDPHTYHAVKNEYAGGDGAGEHPLAGVEVLHVTELLDRLVREGRLAFETPLDTTVTYHDPCYLGRYNGVYEAPRRVLAALGATVAEMPRNRDAALCCGAGGGRIWMEDVPGIKERPAEARVKEAAGVRGARTLVVSCPKDLVMFQDAVKTTQLEGSLVVQDLVQLVEAAGATAVRSDAHVHA
jgi:Fe-S oxidoreductase